MSQLLEQPTPQILELSTPPQQLIVEQPIMKQCVLLAKPIAITDLASRTKPSLTDETEETS